MSKDSPSQPAAPNYTQAAQQQQASSLIDQYTPYGSQVYSQIPRPSAPSLGAAGATASQPSPFGGGVFGLGVNMLRQQAGLDPSTSPVAQGFNPAGQTDPGQRYRSDITLDPQAQHALDTQLSLSSGLGDLANSQLAGVQSQYSKPMDLQSVDDVANKAYGAMTSRLDPQWQQRQQAFDAQMASQGIPVGSEAYNNANREFQQSKNDAYQQANLGAISTMPQTYQLASSIYEQPLNQFNAIRSGVQIQNPQFQAPGMGANYMGAAQAQGQYGQGLYNSQVAQNNSLTSGLFGLGGSLGAAYLLA